MNKNYFIQELLEMPKELYFRGDFYINGKIRPLTKKLNEKNTQLKYILGNNASAINVLLFYSNKSPLPITPIGISSLNLFSNIFLFGYQIIYKKHKGYKENSENIKIIENPFLYSLNQISKNTRFISTLEGISQIGFSLYNLIIEKDSSEFNLFLFNNGVRALNVGIGTYIFQSDDDEPRKQKELFSKSKKTLEKLIENSKLQPIRI